METFLYLCTFNRFNGKFSIKRSFYQGLTLYNLLIIVLQSVHKDNHQQRGTTRPMININFNNLNPLEIMIHDKLSAYSKENSNIRIAQAAIICDCSVSKISKFVKKLGFTNYKQYIDFLYGKEIPESKESTELTRIQQFITDFDTTMIDEFLVLIKNHDKIVFFGYGPSLICAQYFEYKLRTSTNKVVIALSDELSVGSMVDETSLLVIFTVTGSFHSFENVYYQSREKGCEVAIVVEEYNTALFSQCDKIFWLSKTPQPSHLKPYEKSRTIFFIFMEEVIQRLIEANNTAADPGPSSE